MRIAAGAFVLLLLAAMPAAGADDMAPLEDWLRLPAEQQDQSVPFMRCAGLYGAIFGLNQHALSQAEGEELKRYYVMFTISAQAVKWQRLGGNFEDYQPEVLSTTDGYAYAYARRMKAVRDGDPFARDPLLAKDKAFCEPLTAHLPKSLEGLGKP